MRPGRALPLVGLALAAMAVAPLPLAARDAAFMDPGVASAGAAVDAVIVEPKGDIDTGDSVVNNTRRTTLFFANQSGVVVDIVSVAANGDSNVKTDIVNDDCSRESKIAPASRCSLAIETTPVSPGAWTVEVIMTHKGTGRIARAKLTGKASSVASADKKDSGLALSAKEAQPVNFGEVEVGTGKAVRSALMINDSPEPITLLAIDVIAAENGLQRLEQGCAVDMDLKPGESCPVTLVWKPGAKGQVSTDLIIRHTGRLGFAVVPLRGLARDGMGGGTGSATAASPDSEKGKDKDKTGGKVPAQPSADDIAKMISGSVAPVTGDRLGAKASGGGGGDDTFQLIGTVGNRAVILKPDGTTEVAALGEFLTYGDGKSVKVLAVLPREAEISVHGKKRALPLRTGAVVVRPPSSLQAKPPEGERGGPPPEGVRKP